MMEGLEELVDEMVDEVLDDMDEYESIEGLPTRYKDKEHLRELGILIDEYEE